MKYSQIKEIKAFCDELFSQPDYREVITEVLKGNQDFEVNNVRFISEYTIDHVQAEELESDSYVLGCFNADFIAQQTGWPVILIEAAQKGRAYKDLGKAIADSCDMIEFARAYSSADGYGHHFNHYDFGEDEIEINRVIFYVFDNH